MNRNYAKIITPTKIGYAPNAVTIGRTTHFAPTAEQYAEAGYCPVVDTPKPDGDFWRYEWELIDGKVTRVWIEVPDTRTPAEKREYAYETEPIIEYGDGIITVDDARKICDEYAYEDTDRARSIVAELTAKITAAKQAIREEYPDEILALYNER